MRARLQNRRLLVACSAASLVSLTLVAAPPALGADGGGGVFVNELHYDNDGGDTGEALEVAGPAGTDLSGYEVVLYNGNGGSTYDTADLSGTLPDQQGGFGTVVVDDGLGSIQNGSPDGLALVHDGTVVQFLSYEGSFTAVGGPADGVTSTDIGVEETGDGPVGDSLQLSGTGTAYADFSWAEPTGNTFGEVNTDQTFGDGTPGDGGGGDGGGGDGGSPSATCGDESTPTYDIQGTGDTSPRKGDDVAVEGVVTGTFLGENELGGFYLQDPEGDDDPATSDGVFVYDPGAEVETGDAVRVVGTVDEFHGQTQVDEVDSLGTCGHGTVSPTTLPLPLAGADREAYEGMLVTAKNLSVTDNYDLHTYGEVLLSSGGVLDTPTEVATPGAEANQIAASNQRRQLLLDDGQDNQLNRPPYPQPPYLGENGTLRRGDTVDDLTGILGYGFGSYRLEPTEPVDFARVNQRTDAPEDVGGTVRVGSANVLNFFTTLDTPDQTYPDARGADSARELARQQAKIVAEIRGMGADVVGLEELEDEVASGADPAPVQVLVDALNQAASGAETWAAAGLPANYNSHNPIRDGIVYRSDRVKPVGPTVSDDDPVWSEDRQPLAHTFETKAGGEVFTLVANHFKSKGGCPDSGPNADQGDGQSCWNARRVGMSQALLDFVDRLQQSSDDDDVVAVGDFNAYTMEDPVDTLVQGGLTDLTQRAEPEQNYSYVYFGAQGALDHAFATPSLAAKVTGADVWHVNADEPRALDYHTEILRPDDFYHTPNQPGLYQENAYRAADHDPLVVGIDGSAGCDSTPPEAEVEVSPDVLSPPNGRYVEVTATVTTEEDADVSLTSVESDEPDTGPGYGHRADDVKIEDDTHVLLRAERGGRGDGRVYTLTYEITDTCGNTTEATATVEVPHDRGHKAKR